MTATSLETPKDEDLCLSTLEREKLTAGVVTYRQSWKCYELKGHRGRCHGTAPSAPRWTIK